MIATALALGLLASSTLSARLVRLSDWLAVNERTQAGFEKLSADQIAAINALAANKVLTRKGETTIAFSTTLTDSEYAACGLNLLEVEERKRLDELVTTWRATAPVATASPSPFIARPSPDIPFENAESRPKVGGFVSLTYGIAEGGGTLRSGSAVVTYDDPAHGFSAAVGYSRIKADGAFVRPPIVLTRPSVTVPER